MNEPGQSLAAPPAVIVIFGAAGDLTKRKLIPALFNLAAQELLSSQIAMVGIDRVEMDSEAYRQTLSEEIKSYVGDGFNQDLWDANIGKAYYMPGDFRNAESYQQLKKFLLEVDQERFLFASFYTYGPNGEQTWLIAQLDTASGTTANVTVYIPQGGEWGDPSGATTGTVWGSGTMDFPTCSSGSFSFTPNQAMMDMGFTAQSYALERILPSGISCPTFTNNEMAAAMR